MEPRLEAAAKFFVSISFSNSQHPVRRSQAQPKAGDLLCSEFVINSVPIREDASRLKKLGSGFRETFMTVPSPGVVATAMTNQHYSSHDAYLTALSKALANEYRAIHEAGHVLQIDAPDLTMERSRFFAHLDERAFL